MSQNINRIIDTCGHVVPMLPQKYTVFNANVNMKIHEFHWFLFAKFK